jgi:hypothetical protein
VEVDPAAGGSERRLADVEVSFHDLLRNQSGRRSQAVSARFTARSADVEAQANPAILAELGLIDDNAATERALRLLKGGNAREARQVLEQNAAHLEETFRATKDRRLQERVRRSRDQAGSVETAPAKPSILRMKKQISDDPLEGLQL